MPYDIIPVDNHRQTESRLVIPLEETVLSAALKPASDRSQRLIVFVHGAASNASRWEEFVDTTALSQRWTLVRFDLRGHGASPARRPGRLENYADDIAAMIGAAGAHGPIVVVGHSFGAAAALVLARRFPHIVNGLILIDPLLEGCLTPEALCMRRRAPLLHLLEKIVAAIHRGQNIHQHLDLIAGLPYEDYESFGRSFDRVYAMQPEQLQLGFLKVLKGSDMHEHAQEYGIRYLELPPYEVLYTNWISYGEIRRLKRIEEMVELYYNSGQFTHTLPVLENAFSGPFAMYEALADYYQEQGYFTNSPARAYRYQILLEFAAMKDPANREIYRELLTYDMYLRENLKSRPAFAAEITEEEKQNIRRFYQTEEQERHYLPAYDQYDWKQLSRMTHLEPFRYPEPHYVLFDYQERNPLNYEAKVQVIRNPIL